MFFVERWKTPVYVLVVVTTSVICTDPLAGNSESDGIVDTTEQPERLDVAVESTTSDGVVEVDNITHSNYVESSNTDAPGESERNLDYKSFETKHQGGPVVKEESKSSKYVVSSYRKSFTYNDEKVDGDSKPPQETKWHNEHYESYGSDQNGQPIQTLNETGTAQQQQPPPIPNAWQQHAWRQQPIPKSAWMPPSRPGGWQSQATFRPKTVSNFGSNVPMYNYRSHPLMG